MSSLWHSSVSVYVHRNLTLELCAKFGNVGIAVSLDKVFGFFNMVVLRMFLVIEQVTIRNEVKNAKSKQENEK